MTINFDTDELEPLICRVVEETVMRLEAERQKLNGTLAYTEEQASRLLGLEPHVLRDARRRGEIKGTRIVGRRIRYLRDDLLAYLIERRE